MNTLLKKNNLKTIQELNLLQKFKSDGPASVMVFLVALPLCLGIALASGASAFAGIITGIVGGLVIGFLSGSAVSVSGPAAGLTVVVLSSIASLGSFEAFLLALVIAGLLQIVMGVFKAGFLSNFFPSSVILGMLAAIGLILILKQLPHALGYDFDFEGDFAFFEDSKHNTFTDIVYAVLEPNFLAIIICIVSLSLMVFWDKLAKNSWKLIPGALLAVGSGMLINLLAGLFFPEWQLKSEHLVTLPEEILKKPLSEFFASPDFSQISNPQVYIVAITIAVIASIETLLSIEATDRLDTKLRITPLNRELIAQGVGNTILGFIGGIPATAVIVRSSANIVAGAVSKLSAILHAVLLLLSVLFFAKVLNQIPLASLAAVLLVVGYKLTNPQIYVTMFAKGASQYVPFLITIVAIIFTDLLKGISIGLAIGIGFMIFSNFKRAIQVTKRNNHVLIRLRNNVTFLNKSYLRDEFQKIESGAEVIIDGTSASFIDNDIMEAIELFTVAASTRKINVHIKKTRSSSNHWFREKLTL
jgi:MFS superfamily sulfate permease-like transporter